MVCIRVYYRILRHYLYSVYSSHDNIVWYIIVHSRVYDICILFAHIKYIVSGICRTRRNSLLSC